MKTFLLKLLKIQSVSFDSKKIKEIQAFVEKLEDLINLRIKTYLSDGISSLVISNDDTKNFDILFVGHLDVVPAIYPKAFEPYEKNGRIYARGASDMKGPVVAMMRAMKELIEEGTKLTLGLMLTTDEEVGGQNGVGHLLNEVGYRAKVAFIPDGGDNWSICTDEKGILHVKISAKGVSAHGSRPWKGDNANLKLIKCYETIEKHFYEKWGKPTEKFNWIPTLNLGYIQGGDSTNKVSDHAEAKIDFRFPAEVKKEEIIEIVKNACEKGDCEYEEIVSGASNHIDKNNPFLKAWCCGIKDKSEKGTKLFVKAHGASDARFFAEKGVPTIISKPICSEIHVDDEWIDYNSLVEFKDCIKQWVRDISTLLE